MASNAAGHAIAAGLFEIAAGLFFLSGAVLLIAGVLLWRIAPAGRAALEKRDE